MGGGHAMLNIKASLFAPEDATFKKKICPFFKKKSAFSRHRMKHSRRFRRCLETNIPFLARDAVLDNRPATI